jgi:drug/metabolite transporter (DMT)-like permease
MTGKATHMNDRLSFAQIALLVAYAAGMVGGQFLFKLAALRAGAEGPLGERLLAMLVNGYFVAAVTLYAALSVLWVWILSFTPLSRGYVFVALAFAATPLLGGLIFAEPISARLVVGVALICGGLLFVAG